MPQLLILALAGVGAYATYRWASKKMRAAGMASERAKAAARSEPRDLGELRRDPKSGEYRPD